MLILCISVALAWPGFQVWLVYVFFFRRAIEESRRVLGGDGEMIVMGEPEKVGAALQDAAQALAFVIGACTAAMTSKHSNQQTRQFASLLLVDLSGRSKIAAALIECFPDDLA